ncbi:Hint domain-containing protein [Thalassovita taeanensis]|uniref:Ca2+-binding protein, RTX toxin-related n=1 Tax=Thalassovita taeanensis TaxID=657014 RepID=A0A1H8YZ57_9RHOB|nr:Hint domain-containing protein [Thalassovita taeanensis]SEP56658.1 Ca2+-binding protein, RTX toxin-related [Thalassovita taeanensis]
MADLVLDWSLLGAYGTGVSGTTTVETGGVAVNVGFAAVDEGATAFTVNTDNYVAPGEAFDPNSALKLLGLGGEGGIDTTSVTTLDFTASDDAFSDSVQNVSFRLNDIDGGADPDNVAGSHFDKVIIHAYDADGNEVPVVFTPGADVTLGPDRVYSDDPDSYSPTDADASALVSIEGPVARIEIEYANLGDDAQRVYVSDVHFSTVPADPIELDGIVEGTAGDDVIDVLYTGDPEGDMIDNDDAIDPAAGPNDDLVHADDGNDTVFAGVGDDTIYGDEGRDRMFGGDDQDLFNDVTDIDRVDGDEGGVDFDRLDLTGKGPVYIEYTSDDHEDGVVTFLDTGETVSFRNIETIITDSTGGPDGIVQGTAAGEVIDVNYTGDPDGDMIDASDAILPGAAPDDDLVIAGAGDDSIISNLGDDRIYAGVGNDLVDAGVGDDTILGQEGDDSINANDGDDLVIGGAGDDEVYGGAGNDFVNLEEGDDLGELGEGDDTAYGRDGDDYIDGDIGADYIDGGNDSDTLTGNDGDDTLLGGAGDDSVFGDVGDDSLYGGAGDDHLSGGDGDDMIEGGAGNDEILSGTGTNELFGGDDRDVFYAGQTDYVDGGEGGDDFDTLNVWGPATVTYDGGDPASEAGIITFLDSAGDPIVGADVRFINIEQVVIADASGLDGVVEGTAGDDLIDVAYVGDPEGDRIDHVDSLEVFTDSPDDADYPGTFVEILGGPVRGDNRDAVLGYEGDDTIYGGNSDDVIYAGADNDLVYGELGDDVLVGEGGDDTLSGGRGFDRLYGGAGSDLVSGGAGDDMLVGGDGGDYTSHGAVTAGADNDTMDGGAGNDTLIGGIGEDSLSGGDDRDTFLGANINDFVDGNEGGDDFDTLDLRGTTETGGSLHVTYETNPENGTVEYFDATGASTGTMAFQNIENVIPCFTPGTTIATPRGERLVEELREGDRIITRDNGIQEIRWVGARQMTGLELARAPHLKPVLIRAGALGNDLPERDMLVSPNHRMLVNNDKAALYFEEREVLAAAKHLIGGAGIQEVNVVSTTYIHFMFDQHEVVLSNGAWTESFQPGDYTLAGIGNAQRNEILELFPELATQDGIKGYHSARRSLKRHEVQLLVR